MPTTRKVNDHTILAILPEAKTLLRTIGEEPEEGFFYVIIADNGDQTVVATMRNPQDDTFWMSGDYYHGEVQTRRTQAMIAAIERAGYKRLIGEAFVIGNLAEIWGFDPKAV